MWNKVVGLFLVTLIMSSCGKKGLVNLSDNKDKNVTCKIKNIKYKYLSARAKADVTMDSSNQKMSLNIRMQQGKNIWVRASVGPVEGARCLFTKDSVKIKINFPQKVYYRYTYEQLSQMISTQLTFDMLEDVFLGNLLQVDGAENSVESYPDSCKVISTSGTYTLSSSISKDQRVSKLNLTDSKKKGSVDVQYDDFKEIDKNIFAHIVTMQAKDGGKQVFDMLLEYKTVKFQSKALSFPFTVSDKYEVR